MAGAAGEEAALAAATSELQAVPDDRDQPEAAGEPAACGPRARVRAASGHTR